MMVTKNVGRSSAVEFKELGRTGVKIPVLGMGTWGIGGLGGRIVGGEDEAVGALQFGMKLGFRFIDTAEMYGNGHSEEVVAKAVKENRDDVFIATKVSAEHLAHDDVLKACEASLRRLRTNYIDLYQVHWPNTRIPIPETMKAMERLVAEGKIRYVGVSNFSVQQTREAQESLSEAILASNQVEYSLLERSIEADLLPYAQKEHMTIIAYTPVAKGKFAQGGREIKWRVLDEVASKYGKTRIQVALNWLLVQDGVVAIPKAVSRKHIEENLGAIGWALSGKDRDILNKAFA